MTPGLDPQRTISRKAGGMASDKFLIQLFY